MRILDTTGDKALKNICIYLTRDEAKEMLGDLQDLINSMKTNSHSHISDNTFSHEITLTIYDEMNLEGFNERSKILINNDI